MKGVLLFVVSLIPLMLLAQQHQPEPVKTADSSSAKVFSLGEIVITVPSRNEWTSRITAEQMQAQHKFEASRSINMLPGVNLTASGQRNESMVSVRGFDLRAVPVYMDGVPVYVPYDGYVDLARFTTFDLSAIDVSKGFSSLLYGPNSLGGAINLISRKPKSKFEYDGALGMINSNGYSANVNAGANFGKYYVQGGYSHLHRDAFKMSDKYEPHAHEDGGNRDNSYRTDQKFNLKIGWTPNEKQEYVLGYINQQGKKGTPVYAGDDQQNSLFSKPRFWRWPSWNKETYYFLSNTGLNTKNYLKSRIYFDRFKNSINSYDDATYTKQTKPYAFQSWYNDYTYGGSIEFGTAILPKNELKISLHFKEDIHRENDLNEPVRRFEDNTINVAIEDIFKITDRLVLIPGIGYSARKNITAEDYNSATNTITNYAKAGTSAAFNGQIGLFYFLKKNQKISITASKKNRFATIKDRYSYRMGTAIPNPDLKPEAAANYDLTYTGEFFKHLSLQTSLFYSHVSDAILSVSNVQPGKSQMQNTGAAEFMGVELSAKYTFLKNLSAGANYSYIERNNLTNPGVLFTDVPYTKLFSYVQYRPVQQLSLLMSSEYNSLRYSTSYGTKAPGFIVFNAVVAVPVWKYIRVETGVNNIFDKNYMLTEGYPEEGRNFFITLRFFNHK